MKQKKRLAHIPLFLVLTILVGGLFSCGNAVYDYARENLTPYVSLDSVTLNGFTVKVKPAAVVGDQDVNDYIAELQKKAASDKELTDVAVAAGDTLTFLYYATAENGRPIEGLTNYTGKTVSVLLGEGGDSFIKDRDAEFEDPIINSALVPSDYKLVETKSGTVKENDTVIASIVFYYEDTDGAIVRLEESRAFSRMDLSRADSDFEKNLNASLIGLTIGETAKEAYSYIDESSRIIKADITPHFVITEEKTFDITLTLPESYENTDFKNYVGKNVTFHIVPLSFTRPVIPELTREFIKEVTGGKIDSENAVEEFRAVVKSYLQSVEDETYKSALSEACDAELYRLATVTAYPKKALTAAETEVRAYIRVEYDAYVEKNGSSQYPTLLDYEKTLFKNTDGTPATEEEVENRIRELAETNVEEYLIYHAAAKALGVTVADDKLNGIYNEYLAYMTNSTDAEKQKAYETAYNAYYGNGALRRYVAFISLKQDVLTRLSEIAVVLPAD